jgi:iron(III) transport system substrate-binding protein
MSTRFLVALLFALGAGLLTASAWADQVVVVTSFPKELTEAYKKAFEARYPATKVEILNKGTSHGVAFVREAPASARPDVFWASAPDAFEVMAKDGLLQKYAGPKLNIPAKIGNYPINDPNGFYLGQALAGYGIMWNTRYLKAHKLPDPREWSDLARPVYFSHVAMSAPSRSGTTHLTVETILQGEGWNKGWSELLQISGNCAAITERSFGVPDGVSNGQYGIGLVIDFFGLAAKASGFPVEFIYPSVTAIVPANIALIADARNAEGARKFIDFTLSPEGQEILLDPKISRLPVLPGAYARAPKGFPDPYKGTIKAKVNFDADLSEARYYLVSALFDQTITFRIKELNEATKAIHEATPKVVAKKNPQAEQLLAKAREYAFTPVVGAERAADKEFVNVFRATKKDAETAKRMTQIEEYWNSEAKKNYARATELAGQAAALVK